MPSDAQWLSKVWRYVVYRDSGPTLMFNRLQQVEHEAYLTFLAGHAGVRVPEIVAAGRCGPSHDAALVTVVPEASAWANLSGDQVADADIDAFFRSVLLLRRAGIAHGALSPSTVVLTADGPLLRDFRRASSSAPATRTDKDLAAAVAAVAVVVGTERAVGGGLPGLRRRDREDGAHLVAALDHRSGHRAHEPLAEGFPQVVA